MKFDAQWYLATSSQLLAQGISLVTAMPIRKRPQWLSELLLTLLPLIPTEFQVQAVALDEIAKRETAWPDARAVFAALRTRSLQTAPNAWVRILEVIAKEICNSSQPAAPFDHDVADILLQLLAPFSDEPIRQTSRASRSGIELHSFGLSCVPSSLLLAVAR